MLNDVQQKGVGLTWHSEGGGGGEIMVFSSSEGCS